LVGVILSAKDDTLVLRVAPDNIKLEVARSSVVTLTTAEDKQLKS
jgi:preprotein translocase subunit YajC